jgi:Tol biopolymer transport system component
MKKLLIIIGVIITLTNCTNVQKYDNTKPVLSIVFSDKNNLPSAILFEEETYIENGIIFFVLSDYLKKYSKLVKYDTNKNSIDRVIFEANDNENIREYSYKNEIIVFSVYTKENNYSHDIYLYNIRTDELKKINNYPLNVTNEIFPLSLETDGISIVYVEHNFELNTSDVKYYNIETGNEKVLSSIPHGNSLFIVNTFFATINNGTIVFDKVNNGEMEIIVFDVNLDTVINIIKPLKGVNINFKGSLNKENDFIAFFSKMNNTNIIYMHNIKKNKNQSLVRFDQYSLAYDDILFTKNNDILYNVQKNVSGLVKDHYYGEVYRLKNYSMEQILKCFNMAVGENYIAFLKFDDNGINIIHFELYKYM